MPDSPRQTAALAALGLLAAGEAGARAGLRAAAVAAGPSRAVWRSWPLAPARGIAAPVLGALVSLGHREEERLQAALERGVTERAVGIAVDHEVVERATAELLQAGVLENVATQIAASPLLDRALASPELERLLVRVMQSGLVDDLTDRVLASEELQRIVEHVARSEEVRRALTAQSAGLVDEVAGAVRSRSAGADDAAERLARRLLGRRRPRPGPLGPEPG